MFNLASEQFGRAADALKLDPNIRERLRLPQRAVVVTVLLYWLTTSFNIPLPS